MAVTFINAQRVVRFDVGRLKASCELLLSLAGLPCYGYGVRCSADGYVRHLNATYRQKHKATDVLSFPNLEIQRPGRVPKRPVEGVKDYLGDMVLGMGYINRQCLRAEISLDDRLIVVVTHGFCHLLGYTHDTDKDYKKMHAKEAEFLRGLQKEFGGNLLHPLDNID